MTTGPGGEPTFADVLNGLTFGGRRGRRARSPESPWSTTRPGPGPVTEQWPARSDLPDPRDPADPTDFADPSGAGSPFRLADPAHPADSSRPDADASGVDPSRSGDPVDATRHAGFGDGTGATSRNGVAGATGWDRGWDGPTAGPGWDEAAAESWRDRTTAGWDGSAGVDRDRPVGADRDGGEWEVDPGAAAGDGADAAIVRPYAWTRGRTRSSLDLQVETLVSALDQPGPGGPLEHRAIAELCGTPHSVAEIAALLRVPLGVAKVLVSDMAEAGRLTVHTTTNGVGTQAHFVLMERVLSGLRRL